MNLGKGINYKYYMYSQVNRGDITNLLQKQKKQNMGIKISKLI